MDKKGTRRQWSDMEERILMDNLKELVATRWKTENGFKPGYQKRLEDMMLEQLPGTDIRAIPHINSKITMWKRLYSSLRTMIDDKHSGIGFNTTTGLIDCNDEQWTRAVAKDPNAANMRLKSWKMYEDWLEVFGNDRATGKTAENVSDAYSNLVEEENGRKATESAGGTPESTYAPNQTEFNMETDDFYGMDGSTGQNADASTPPATRTAQRKRSASTSTTADPIVEILGKLVTSSDERLNTIYRAIGYEADLGKTRREIFQMLDCIPNLTLDQKIDVSKVLAGDSGRLEMFMGFSLEARARYVVRLLNGDAP